MNPNVESSATCGVFLPHVRDCDHMWHVPGDACQWATRGSQDAVCGQWPRVGDEMLCVRMWGAQRIGEGGTTGSGDECGPGRRSGRSIHVGANVEPER
jgi:hypothetical protein